jgi:hypothetical protein
MESFAAFEQAVASTAEIVKGVPTGQMTAPTPCTEWDVRALLASHVLAFARQALTEETRAGRIGPAVAVPADAPVTDRLAAFLGRQP